MSRGWPAGWRNRHHLVADGCVLFLGTLAGYLARFDGLPGLSMSWRQGPLVVALLVLRLVVLRAGGAYGSLWRHGGAAEFRRVGAAGLAAGGLHFLVGGYLAPSLGLVAARVPLSILALDWVVTILVPVSLRVGERLVYLSAAGLDAPSTPGQRVHAVLVVGAGEAGRTVALAMQRNTRGTLRPVGFVDDDPAKHGRQLVGLPVLGGTGALGTIARATGASEIVLAMPSAPGEVVRRIYALAREAGIPVRTVPSLAEVVSGRIPLTAIRQLRVEDLLRREPVVTDLGAVETLLRGKRVLVTGAGGSIGRELSRQVAALGPAAIGLLGHGENSIFEVEQELREWSPGVATRAFVADIRDTLRMAEVFASFRPQIVFHAAAHKHVPLMEGNATEAITNNVLGTRCVAELAVRHRVERFVMISTDKAVRPTNVMGRSKRAAELVVQELARRSGANLTAVRFGNVLGSRGSVVPTFMRQIAAGGPIAVTHPEVRRYFMSIPESVQLVLQAATLGTGGEVFALDMGAPVRIVDLAEQLIRLSGLEPGRDIAITFTGLRAGEKMYEEVFFEGDDVTPTTHAKIRRSRERAGTHEVLGQAEALQAAVDRGEPDARLRAMLADLVDRHEPAAKPARRADAPIPADIKVSAPARTRPVVAPELTA